MPKLSDTQAVLLAAAAERPDLTVLPAPETLSVKGAALERSLQALLRAAFIAQEVDAGGHSRLIITAAGIAAISVGTSRAAAAVGDMVPDSDVDAAPKKRPVGKLGALLDAVSHPAGATLEDLSAAAGWLPHTTRAAISRLRQRGYDVRIVTTGTRKVFQLIAAD